MSSILKAASIFNVPTISFIGKGGIVELIVDDPQNSSSKKYVHKIGDTIKEFVYCIKVETFQKAIPDAYTVSLCKLGKGGYVQLKSTKYALTYFMGIEPKKSKV
jgi:hypothetical protein